MILSAMEAKKRTIEALKAQVPATIFQIINDKIEKAVIAGKSEVVISDEELGLQKMDMSKSIKLMKSLASYLRVLGYSVPEVYGMENLSIKWL